MATSAIDLVPMLIREVNPPGNELYPEATGSNFMFYIADGFWDARLSGIMKEYKIINGEEFVVPLITGVPYVTTQDEEGDLPRELWMMLVVFAGLRLIRLKILNLAINFKAKAGPVEYEQQASATTLRAVLDSLLRRIAELKSVYSDDVYSGTFILMDGMAQAAYAEAAGLNEFFVLR